ncbi:MAG: pseudouridine synthase [Bacteroidales bacterium]|nr:pseudouridine synthase [Bacteroidales bacterium]
MSACETGDALSGLGKPAVFVQLRTTCYVVNSDYLCRPKILEMNQKDQSGKRPRIQEDQSEKGRDAAKKPFKNAGEKPPFRRADSERRYDSGSEKSFSSRRRDDATGGDRQSFKPRRDDASGGERTFTPRRDDASRGDRPYSSRRRDEGGGGDRPFKPRRDDASGGERTFTPRRDDASRGDRPYSSRRRDEGGGGDRPFKPRRDDASGGERRSYPPRERGSSDNPKKLFVKRDGRQQSDSGYRSGASKKPYAGKPSYPEKEERHRNYRGKSANQQAAEKTGDGMIRLNKYLADSGVCSRREADKLIEAGVVSVNGEVVTQLGTKVNRKDKVNYGGQTLKRETLRYVLLNKPKGFITTSDDPQKRRTVMELVANACDERIYPVGRLDRNTLGLLLLTNDGELAKKLTHPSHGVKKLYHVTLDKALTKNDMIAIANGLELEDGPVKVEGISWVSDEDSKKEVGLEIHSGKNRIVRRIFESLGYEVVKLDRVVFASLTKVNLPRGRWRHLSETELAMLRMIK